MLANGHPGNVKASIMIEKKDNKWLWPFLLVVISLLISYLTGIWFLVLFLPLGFIKFRGKDKGD